MEQVSGKFFFLYMFMRLYAIIHVSDIVDSFTQSLLKCRHLDDETVYYYNIIGEILYAIHAHSESVMKHVWVSTN